MKNLCTKCAVPMPQTSNRKCVFIKLPFKGDELADIVQRQLSMAVSSAYNAARAQFLFARGTHDPSATDFSV